MELWLIACLIAVGMLIGLMCYHSWNTCCRQSGPVGAPDIINNEDHSASTTTSLASSDTPQSSADPVPVSTPNDSDEAVLVGNWSLSPIPPVLLVPRNSPVSSPGSDEGYLTVIGAATGAIIGDTTRVIEAVIEVIENAASQEDTASQEAVTNQEDAATQEDAANQDGASMSGPVPDLL